MTSDATWTTNGSPYIASQSVVIMNGATLTILPGVEVRFDPKLGLLVNDGCLVARGTSTNPIKFTANASPRDSASNHWAYLRFEDAAVDASFDSESLYTNGCILEHAVLEYGGGGGVSGVIHATKSNPFVSGCEIFDSDACGIAGESVLGIRILDNTISNTARYGISIEGTNALLARNSLCETYGGLLVRGVELVVESNRVVSSGNRGIQLYGASNTVHGNTFSMSSSYGIWILGSSMRITENEVSGGDSEGINIEAGGALQLKRNKINNNKGSGIYFFQDYSGNSCIADNIISGNQQGVYGARDLVLSNNVIIANSNSTVQGVAFYVSAMRGRNVTLIGNVISKNHAPTKSVVSISGADIVIARNVICENNCPSGNVLRLSGTERVACEANVISGNTAAGGSVIFFSGAVSGAVLSADQTHATIVADNIAQYQLYNDSSYTDFTDPRAPGNIDACNVWWGTTNYSDIQAGIYDFFDDAGKGRVFVDPFVTFKLTIENHGCGSVARIPQATTYDPMTVVDLTAQPSNYWYFTSWSNFLSGTSSHTNVTMTGDITLDAYFAPFCVTNGVPVWWLAGYGLGTNDSDALADTDFDSYFNWQEWIAGTDPTNDQSFFHFQQMDGVAPGGLVIRWPSLTGRTYTVERSTNLLLNPAFANIATGIEGRAISTVHTDSTAVGTGPWLYRVSVE